MSVGKVERQSGSGHLMSPRTIAPIEERRLLGIGLALVSFLLFTCIDSSAKWLGQSGLPTQQVVFIRYGVHLFLMLAVFLPREKTALVRTRRPGLEVVRALCLMASTVLNFFALKFLPLTTTASIAFTMPIIICLLSIPLLGERVGWRRWTAIVVGLVGVLVIIRPGTDSFHPAAILSLLAAGCGAGYSLLTRKLAGIDSTWTLNFYAAGVATTCLLPFAMGDWVWPPDGPSWIAFGLIGLAGFSGHLLTTEAHRFAPASVLAPFAYTQIVWMTLSSWLIFGQPPDGAIYIGAPIVIASGLYIWLRERALQKPAISEMAPAD
jgi:drug/metabolite transporter (DMT)-like permease